MICVFCGEEIHIEDKVSRNDTCSNCNRDLHCCKQCKFYDPHAYNECHEVSAERVFDKDRANFCEFFVPRGALQQNVNRAKEAKDALEALFKNKK